MKRASLVRSTRSLADTTGVSRETSEFAADMAAVVSRSAEGDDRLPSAVAAGCLYAAALAVETGTAADQSRSRTPTPNRNWNPQVGHNRSDHGGTEMTISKAASITPVSLRKHSREAATAYLDADTDADSHVRQRLSRLTLR